jgi:hypothetical protein
LNSIPCAASYVLTSLLYPQCAMRKFGNGPLLDGGHLTFCQPFILICPVFMG